MEVSKSILNKGALIFIGHDKMLNLRNSMNLDHIWGKKPDPNRKISPDHLKVMIDEYG